MEDNLATYLNNRGVIILERKNPLEITENEQLLAEVAGAWESNQQAIRAVVQARCDVLREKILISDIPYEVPVSRQALIELAGILQDFENMHTEYSKRKEDEEKGKTDNKGQAEKT